MRKAHQILAGILAAMVVIQAMSIAYALAGLGYWIENDGGVVSKAVFDAWDEDPPTWQGSGGFGLHAVSGMTLIPLLAIVFLVVSLFAAKQVQGAAQRASILFGMVLVQVFLGIFSHEAVLLAPLHALNGFGIFAMAIVAVRKAAEPATVAA